MNKGSLTISNIVGVVNDRSYGLVCYNILKQWQTKFFPLHPVQADLDFDYKLINSCINKPFIKAPSIKIWHADGLSWHPSSPMIGFPIFELDSFTAKELEQLRVQDGLVVCSQWAKNVLDKYNLSGTICPLGVDRNIFFDSPLDDGPTRFICLGKWEVRKGHDFLIEAFEKAFTNEDVELYMSCTNPFNTPQENERWLKLYQNSKIKILPWFKTQLELAHVMRQMHCGVFLSRAEGWNLEALEMLSVGRPIIITNYSGHTEYCSSENSLLVEPGPPEIALDGKWFFGQGKWASLGKDQLDQTIEHMRFIHKNRYFNQAGIETANKFSWNNTVEKIKCIK